MILLFLTLLSAFAAWPDSFEHRIAAMEALRYDYAMPGVPYDKNKVFSKYTVACEKGYYDVCHPEEWVGDTQSDIMVLANKMEKKCSKSKSPLQCVLVGIAYGMKDKEVSTESLNPSKAFGAFQTACEDKAYAPGCTYLGDMYLAGVGTDQDTAKAKAYYEEACTAKDIWGCHRLGDLLLNVHQDATSALVEYRKSCSYGYELGCMAQAGVMFDTATSQSDWAFVATQFDRACTYGQLERCGQLARLYHHGKGVKRSLPLAKALYQSTCASGIASSCQAMGMLYLEMSPPNFTLAGQTFFDACEGGYAPSCTRYGSLVLDGQLDIQNVEYALRFMNKGCDAGDLEGCLVLADAYAKGRGVATDQVKAKQLATQTCDAGFGQGCYVLAQIGESETVWGTESSMDTDALYQQSCTLGYGYGCSEIALRAFSTGQADVSVQEKLEIGCRGGDVRACLAMGNIFRVQPTKALSYWDSACSLSSMEGCLEVGKHWKEQSDLTKASDYFERVCTFGDDRGCQALEPIAFQGKFQGLVERAWLSNLCQVWGENDAGDLRLLAEATGANMQLHVGQYAGSKVTVWHLGNEVFLDTIQRGESRWNVGGKLPSQENMWTTGEELDHTKVEVETDDPWGEEQAMDWDVSIKHIEEWDASKGEISRDFPGEKTVMLGDKGIVNFARNDEVLFGQCGYFGNYPTLKVEHCSDIQALILGYVLMDCSVTGKPTFLP